MLDNIEIPEEMKNQMTIGSGDDESDSPAVKVEQEQKVSSQPVYLGGRRFDNMEDLAAYTSGLETKVMRSEFTQESMSPALQNANKVKPSDLLFSDPDAYHEYTVEQAESRILGKINKAEAEKNVWNNFYQDFDDLKEHRGLVEFKFNERKKDYGDLPADQALAKIGKEVRSYIGKIRGKPEGGKELPSGSAVVASSSNNVSPNKTPVADEPKDMATQMRQWQKRGR